MCALDAVCRIYPLPVAPACTFTGMEHPDNQADDEEEGNFTAQAAHLLTMKRNTQPGGTRNGSGLSEVADAAPLETVG